MKYALGRLPNDPNKPRIRLSATPGAAPPPPASADWYSQVKTWPMSLNDQIGDCTAAGAAHIAQQVNWFGQNQNAPVADGDVLTFYSAISGYNPNTGQNDNGATLQDALGQWRTAGIGGNRIAAFAQIDATNLNLVRTCIAIFGSVYTGFAVPKSAMDQFDNRQPWTVVKRDRIVGGHCVPLVGYDTATFTAITWGATQKLDLGFYTTYFAAEHDVWVPIDLDWMRAVGTSPAGLDTATLNADYTALTGQPGPFPAVTPTPGPGPAPTPSPSSNVNDALAAAAQTWLTANGYTHQHGH